MWLKEGKLFKMVIDQMSIGYIYIYILSVFICTLMVNCLFPPAKKKGVRAADSSVLLSSNLKIPVILHTEPFADCSVERCNLVSV